MDPSTSRYAAQLQNHQTRLANCWQRAWASNYDPNRDHIRLERSHTQAIKTLTNEFDPHVLIDMHEYSVSVFL